MKCGKEGFQEIWKGKGSLKDARYLVYTHPWVDEHGKQRKTRHSLGRMRTTEEVMNGASTSIGKGVWTGTTYVPIVTATSSIEDDIDSMIKWVGQRLADNRQQRVRMSGMYKDMLRLQEKLKARRLSLTNTSV